MTLCTLIGCGSVQCDMYVNTWRSRTCDWKTVAFLEFICLYVPESALKTPSIHRHDWAMYRGRRLITSACHSGSHPLLVNLQDIRLNWVYNIQLTPSATNPTRSHNKLPFVLGFEVLLCSSAQTQANTLWQVPVGDGGSGCASGCKFPGNQGEKWMIANRYYDGLVWVMLRSNGHKKQGLLVGSNWAADKA